MFLLSREKSFFLTRSTMVFESWNLCLYSLLYAIASSAILSDVKRLHDSNMRRNVETTRSVWRLKFLLCNDFFSSFFFFLSSFDGTLEVNENSRNPNVWPFNPQRSKFNKLKRGKEIVQRVLSNCWMKKKFQSSRDRIFTIFRIFHNIKSSSKKRKKKKKKQKERNDLTIFETK